ncbi:MAG: tRNA pseudouridine(38-40) synthase TruA [Chloroflexota bacterium]
MSSPANSGKPAEHRLRVTVEYDGTNFLGFQRQARGRTVQAVLEAALGLFTPEPWVLAAGRTDAGVHAMGQVIHLNYAGHVPIARLAAAVNGRLPDDVAIRECRAVHRSFHARYSALTRTYHYSIIRAPERRPLPERYAWRLGGPLDVPAMTQAAALFHGTHSFRHFGAIPGSAAQRELSLRRHGWRRTIISAGLVEVVGGEDSLRFEIEANAFLTHMVRAVVGALIAVGCGRLALTALQAALEDDTSSVPLAPIAPPHGLCLFRVRYPDEE